MKQIALLSFCAIALILSVAFNTAPASDGGSAQINTYELTINAKNLVDNTVAEAF